MNRVLQLPGGVPVVDVDGHGSDLVRSQRGLDVLHTVLQIEPDVVSCLYALFEVPVGQSVGLLLELRVGPALFPTAKRNAIRHAVSDRLPDVGQIEITHKGVRFPRKREQDRTPGGISRFCPRTAGSTLQDFRPTHNITWRRRPVRYAPTDLSCAPPRNPRSYTIFDLVRRVESVTTTSDRSIAPLGRASSDRGSRRSGRGRMIATSGRYQQPKVPVLCVLARLPLLARCPAPFGVLIE